MNKMQMIYSNTVGKEVTIDSNNLYDYIGLMPAHTKISQKDLLTIFKCVLFLNKQNDEDKGNEELTRSAFEAYCDSEEIEAIEVE